MMRGLQWRLSLPMKIIFDKSAINTIREMNPSKFTNEQGGIILGEIFSDYLLIKE